MLLRYRLALHMLCRLYAVLVQKMGEGERTTTEGDGMNYSVWDELATSIPFMIASCVVCIYGIISLWIDEKGKWR